MKAPNFSYLRPATLEEALNTLDRHKDGGMLLAGGQTLLAALNLRLSSPDVLIDISSLSELKGIAIEAGIVRIGAMTRHIEILNSRLIAEHLPLLREALRNVAHPAIRNRGTIGGSVANSDPAAELPACMVAAGATIVVANRSGRRTILAKDFFTGLFETALQVSEMIVEFRIPIFRKDQRWGFLELSRRRGDFALAGIAALINLDGSLASSAQIVYFGCTTHPKLATTVANGLAGRPLPLTELNWIREAVQNDVEPMDMTKESKLKLAFVVTERMLTSLA